MANYQQKQYVVMKFIYDEKHIVFNDVGKGRRRKEVVDGVEVIIAQVAHGKQWGLMRRITVL